jgi:hypothetical protein
MPRRKGLVGKAAERLEEATGQTIVSRDRLDLLEQSLIDYRVLARDVEEIGWSLFDYAQGSPQELRRDRRMAIVQRARYVWMNDPQAGAAVELMNDFCFGRGVPTPRCKDKKVQEVVDDAWDDPDNQEVLTSLESQLALGTDLALQSNCFLLMFDDGDDGKVKLSILRHDDVNEIISDPLRRHRSLWYVCRRPLRQEFDFVNGVWNTRSVMQRDQVKPVYYKHWRNVELAEEDASRADPYAEEGTVQVPQPPAEMVGDGKVYHARINRYTEMKFGAPRFQRTLRWYTAYNDFVRARIDVAQAAAAFIMKRKVKGTPDQLARDAAKLISRSSLLAQGVLDRPPEAAQLPPRPGSIMEENDSVSHEALALPSGSAQAQQDANIIRAPLSAAERFPQSYFGDATNSNLATATSLELPVLKAVENRQEVFEAIFRWFVDRVIERAVEAGLISDRLDPEEIEDYTVTPDALQQALQEACDQEARMFRTVLDVASVQGTRLEEDLGGEVWIVVSRDPMGRTHFRLVECAPELRETHEDAQADELATNRDLSYELSMPSPLRRMMTDLVAAITQIAQTFDPNNTNVELSRALLTIALGEALEVADPADLVEKILPPGYQDPLLAAQMAAAQQPAPGGVLGDQTTAAGGDQIPPGGDGSYPGQPTGSTQPENARGIYQMQQSNARRVQVRGRGGLPLELELREWVAIDEAAPARRGPEPLRVRARAAGEEAEALFRADVADVVLDRLEHETLVNNGDGKGAVVRPQS